MVVPFSVYNDATKGRVDSVRNWLDADPTNDVNDATSHGDGLLTAATHCHDLARGLELAQLLLERGVDVNQHQQNRSYTSTALHIACYNCASDTVQLLLQYGADMNRMIGAAPVIQAHTPLSLALGDVDYFGFAGGLDMLSAKASRTGRSLERICRDAHESMLILLRAGAKLGTGGAWGGRSETMLERLIGDEQGDTREVRLAKVELKHSLELIKAIRAAGGTWRKYCLVVPKQVLVLRSLVARDRARVKATTPRRLAWLMSPNVPNEIAWRVLEYWNPRSDGTKYHREY
jgi:hypothetical protein